MASAFFPVYGEKRKREEEKNLISLLSFTQSIHQTPVATGYDLS